MANPEHVAKLKEGARAWNDWRLTNDEKPDLSGVHLFRTSLDHYDLTEADFSDSRLSTVNFLGAFCRAVSFERAFILDGVFRSAPLMESSFRKAEIRSTTFDWCHLERSDFTDSMFEFNTFAHVFLQDARGLDTIEHFGTSSIAIDTFFDSGGLPESFLRGSGVPEVFIQYAASLVGKAIEYYSCFLSYSSKDNEFARRLYDGL